MSHFSTTLRKLFLILLLGCWGSRISSEYFKSSKWYGWGWVKGQLDGFHECLDSGNSHGKTFVFLPFWRTLQRLMVRLGFLFFEVPVWCFRLKLLMLFIYSCSMKIRQVITLRLDSRDAARDAPKRGWVQLLGGHGFIFHGGNDSTTRFGPLPGWIWQSSWSWTCSLRTWWQVAGPMYFGENLPLPVVYIVVS